MLFQDPRRQEQSGDEMINVAEPNTIATADAIDPEPNATANADAASATCESETALGIVALVREEQAKVLAAAGHAVDPSPAAPAVTASKCASLQPQDLVNDYMLQWKKIWKKFEATARAPWRHLGRLE